jgi:DNA-binding transcriptional regulator YhcF (GntR family)
MAIAIYLEYKSNVALYRRLSDALRKAILEGRLKLGEPMPSIRELSETLKLSRSTILKAYEDLKTQGLVVAQSGSGTFVTNTLPGDLGDMAAAFLSPSNRPVSFKPLPLSERGRTIFEVGRRDKRPNMSTCLP